MRFAKNGAFGDSDSLLQGSWRLGRYGINEAGVQHSRRSREPSIYSRGYHRYIRFKYPFSCISFCSRLFSSFNISSAGSCRYLTSSFQIFTLVQIHPVSKMVRFTSVFTCLALLFATSAVPVTIPLGTTGQSLSVSEDGKTISVDGRSINLDQALNARGVCKHEGKKHHGKGGASSNSTAATPGAKAIYFITNAAENSVVALNVATDGTLSDGSITTTGGAGLSGVDSTGAPAAPDSLFSQGAVKTAGNFLVAVNPGSNTLSMFSISPTDPTQLTCLGSPQSTLGDFPVSVSLSTKLSVACVANSGARAGVACLSMTANGLAPLDTALRPFAIGQTTPPSGPENTVSQTFFNADDSALLTTVKGNPAVNNTGFLSVFPVANGAVSMQEARSSPAGTAVLFGTALLPNSNNIFVTDASFGSATLSLNAQNIASVVAKTPIADQKATCWAAFSDVTGTAFVTDVAVNHLVEVDTVTGTLIKELNSTNGNPGMIDLVSAGNFVYALSPGNASVKAAVAVFDVSGGRGTAKEIQNFNPSGVPDSAQGMAFI